MHDRSPLQLTFIYLLLALFWILFSDGLLVLLGIDRDMLARFQLLKGFGFVIFTSGLLYLALQQFKLSQENDRQALKASEQRFSLALDAAQEGLWDWDIVRQKVFFSRRYAEMLGLAQDLDPTIEDWMQLVHPEDRPSALLRLEKLLAAPVSGQLHDGSFRMCHSDGRYIWVRSRGQLLLDIHGKPARLIGTAIDITRQRADEDSLRQAAAVFDSTLEGVLVTDAQQRIVHVNPAFSRITGYSQDEVLGKDPRMLKSGRHDAEFYRNLWHALNTRDAWSGEIWNRRKSGEIYPQWQSIRSVRDERGTIDHYVAVFSDITAIKRSHSEMDFLAHHDPLTQLPNRLLFTERVENAVLRAQREKREGAVLLIDLDHFKNINESLGHNVGDQLLKAIGERLRGELFEDMTLARLGGDEFGLLCEEGMHADQISAFSQRLLDVLAQPFEINQETLYIGASFGISLFPEDGSSVEQLMRNADSALFKAKSSGRQTFAFYSQEMTELARQRVRLEGELRLALEQDQLRVHYQPVHELASGRIIGVEALVRWQHPQRGLVPPGEFIPIAEDSGLIGLIDVWVLEQACRQMRLWQADNLAIESIAVNVSSRLFGRGKLDLRVARVLAETGLDPACLELEVTESAVMDDPDRALELLTRLRALGVHLAIDDFGTGYSSLARLKRLPVHKLKLDQSFVHGLPDDKDDASIARAVIALGHSLGLQVLAEGIEKPEQAAFLLELGCELGQGYWFGRPQPADELVIPVRS